MSPTPLLAWATAAASAALLALYLGRGRLAGRLFLDALAIGLALGASVAVALAPFDLKANPLHVSPQAMAFLFAGLPEEGVKLVGVAAFLRAHYLARDRRDVVFAAGVLSLGFATLENTFYLANAGAGWATLAAERALTAMPFHVFLGLAGGFVVASLRPGLRGAALAVAAWLGLAGIHGVYDFAVFAGASGAPAPEMLRGLAATFGWDIATALRALLFLAEAAAAVAGVTAVFAVRPERVAARGRWARLLVSRGLGWGIGGPLAVGAALALGAGGLTGVMVGSPDLFFRAAIGAVMPLALGLAFLAGSAPVSTRGRRALGGAGVFAALGLSAAAWAWGPAEWRELNAQRFEARGARMAARGDYTGAIEAYGRALDVEPGRIAALGQRAAANAALNRYNAALADLDAALRIAPGTIALYVQRADIDRRRNEPAASAVDLDAALQNRPGDPELLALRAQARLESGDAKGAHDDLAEASRTASDNAVVRRTLAAYDVNAGDLDGALRQLNAQLHANPADATAAFQRGRIWLYKDEPARAGADFVRADDNAAFLYPALWRFLAEARLGRGAANLQKRLAAAPDSWPAPVARLLLGEIGYAAARAAAASDGERCEADFYFAMSRLPGDLWDESAARLRTALKECPAGFIEYEGAKVELRRIAP